MGEAQGMEPEKRTCSICGGSIVVEADLMPSIKAMTWVDGEEYSSVEFDGWILVWWEEEGRPGRLVASHRPCTIHLMPNHDDGPVVALLPRASSSENS